MPEANMNIRVKDLLERTPQQIEVVESVCQVDRLQEVCSMGFSSIPVVNMAGRIIGLIPANFVITLIEHHQWYAEEKIKGGSEAGEQVSNYYTTALRRQASVRLSQGDLDGIDSDVDSPRGSIDGSAEKKKRKKHNKIEPTVEKLDADDSINHRDTNDSKKKQKESDEKVLTYSENGED